MGRPKATRLPDKKVYTYEVGYLDGDLLLIQEIEATMVIPEWDYLKFFNTVDGVDRMVAIFREWRYYKLKPTREKFVSASEAAQSKICEPLFHTPDCHPQ